MSKLMQWSTGATILIEIYINGQWVDITDYVLPPDRGDQVKGSVGRQTELTRIDAANMSLVLENRDNRFTPGNLSSPLSPYWKSGVPIRWSETLGARTFRFPTMYVEIPEVQVTFQDPLDSTATDRVLRVQCVDLLTHLNRAPRFVSNLGAHIMGQRKTSLVGYWPMNDAASPFTNAAGSPVLRPSLLTSSAPPLDGSVAQYLPAAGSTLPGDDRPGLSLIPARGSTAALNSYSIDASYDAQPLTLAAGQVVTMVCWFDIPVTFDDDISLLTLDTFDGLVVLDKNRVASTAAGTLRLFKPIGTGTGEVFSSSYPTGPGPHIVALRYGPTASANVLEFWFDGLVYTTTLSAPLASDRVSGLSFAGGSFLGTVSHGQFYLGAASDFTNADFLAQRQIGLRGFQRQSVDQRIRSIAKYAGLTDAQLDLEPSDSLMPEAAWAGRRPGDLSTSASVTGGGILFTRGEQLVYQDRKHRFSQ